MMMKRNRGQNRIEYIGPIGRICLIAITALFLGSAFMSTHAAEQAIPLWPNGAPGAQGTDTEDIPTLTPFVAPSEKSFGGAIVVCPGGGYGGLADHEGKPIAEWLNSIGVSGFVLKYRHAPKYRHPIPLGDAQRAIRLIRELGDGETDILREVERVGILDVEHTTWIGTSRLG